MCGLDGVMALTDQPLLLPLLRKPLESPLRGCLLFCLLSRALALVI